MYMSRARVSADSQETLVSYLLRTGAQNDALGEDQPRSSADVELEAAGDRPAGCQTDLGAELIWGWTARRDARSSLSLLPAIHLARLSHAAAAKGANLARVLQVAGAAGLSRPAFP